MRIWITRAQPGADATAERLRALHFAPVITPVLQVQALQDAPSLEGVGAVAFTSGNAVRAFAGLIAERELPVFAVGDSTAAAAREAGFTQVTSAAGDVSALADRIAQDRQDFVGEVLYPAPAEPAGDLVAALADRGVPARSLPVYRTAAADFTTPPDIDAVMIHSAKAARRLAQDPALAPAAPAMAAICISAAAAEPLSDAGFREILVASAPNEAAMLEALRAWAARQAPTKLFTPLFWTVIAFALLCMAAAILVASLGPQLFPPRGH